MPNHWIAFSLGCLAVGGCAERESPRESAAATWTIDPVPSVEISATDSTGRVVFGSAAGATRLSDGQVVIADRAEAVIRYFSASGSPIQSAGRRGSGPNEFAALSWVGQCGTDSVFAWDPMLARMSVLDAQGRFSRQVRLDPAPSVLTCARNGTLVYFGQPIAASSSLSELETARYSAPLWIGVGEVARVIDTLPLGEPRPLGRVSRLAAWGDRIVVGTSDSAAVEVRDREGGFIRNVLLMSERRPATRAHYEHAIDRQLMQLPSAVDRAPVRALMLDMPMPEYLPAYSGIVADPDGRFWVQVSAPGDSATEIVIIAEGANPQTVRVPIALDILEVGHDYLLASYQNSDGEEYVGLFPLRHTE